MVVVVAVHQMITDMAAPVMPGNMIAAIHQTININGAIDRPTKTNVEVTEPILRIPIVEKRERIGLILAVHRHHHVVKVPAALHIVVEIICHHHVHRHHAECNSRHHYVHDVVVLV
jgi:hypothetical protein